VSGNVSATPLFRAEAVQAQTAQHLGSIRIGRNPRFTAVAWVALALGAALIAFAAWGEVTRKARIAGLLTPTRGSLQMTAQAAGVVTNIAVAEGAFVTAGQPLFTLNTDRAGTAGDTAALVAQNLQQRRVTLDAERALRELQARQRQQALSDRIRALQTEQAQADNEAQLAERRVALAEKSVQRYQQLAREGFVADVQSQQKQEELLDLQARADAAKRNASALQREQQALKAELAASSTQLQTEQAQLDRSQASLAQESTENQSRQRMVVTAPQAGSVTALHVHTGAAVQPGQALATLIPQHANDNSPQLEAQLYAPSRTAGFVQAGQTVWLRYAAYPYQKFGMARGQVRDVSRTPVNAQELPAGQGQALLQAAQSNEPLYRIRVQLARQQIDAYGQAQLLKPGMALEADVIQDRRAVWEWVLEPIIATGSRWKVLSQQNPGADATRLAVKGRAQDHA
jgi:membrane fusion protein